MHKMLTSDLLKTQDGWALHLFMINYGQIWAPGICSNKLLGPWGKGIYPEIPSCQLHWSHLLQGTNLRQSNMRMEATLRRLKDCLFHILIAWAIKQTHLVLMSLEYCTFSVSHMPLLMLLWAAHFGLEVRLLAFFNLLMQNLFIYSVISFYLFLPSAFWVLHIALSIHSASTTSPSSVCSREISKIK